MLTGGRSWTPRAMRLRPVSDVNCGGGVGRQPGVEVGDRRIWALDYRGRGTCIADAGTPFLWGFQAVGNP